MSLTEETRLGPHYGQLGNHANSTSNSSAVSSDLAKENGCAGRCCQCLASVPCSALLCWLLTTLSVGACGGATLVGARRTIQLLGITQEAPTDVICLGVIFGMVGLVTLFLIADTFTARPLNADFLASAKKTTCVQAWLVVKMMLLLLLLVTWIAVCLAIAYPLTIVTMVYVLYYRGETCVDLKPYLLSSTEHLYCGPALYEFHRQSEPTFECYLIAMVGAILTVISLVFYLMYTAANFIQIKEMGPTQYNIYKNDLHGPKQAGGSVLDTRM